MKDYTKRFEGTFRCDEIEKWNYNGICAYFNHHWLNIPYLEDGSDRLRSEGPQIRIECLNTMYIINSINHWKESYLKLNFSGNYLGYIDSYSGYTAADIGSGKFIITQFDFEITPKSEYFLIQLSGRCDKNYCAASNLMHLSNKVPNFLVEFTVNKTEIANLFSDQRAELIQEKFSSI